MARSFGTRGLLARSQDVLASVTHFNRVDARGKAGLGLVPPSRSFDLQRRQQALDCADTLFDLASYLTADGAEAEDLVQETYARALGSLDSFTSGTSMKAWLCRILRNVFISQWRHRVVQEKAEAENTASPDAPSETVAGDPELASVRAVVARDIERALRSLSSDARTVILLDQEGLTQSEIAEVMGCADGTVKSRLSRARAQLRERLADYGK
jgi:RNA polymerase sigma-70 factor (ECF subfamily)